VINSRLHQALENDLKVKIKYYWDKRFKSISGRIKRVDLNRREIVINDEVIDVEDLLELNLL
jgi:hypothetical protein